MNWDVHRLRLNHVRRFKTATSSCQWQMKYLRSLSKLDMYWCVPYLTCNDKPIKINNRVISEKREVCLLKCPVNVFSFHNFSVIHNLKWWMEERWHLSIRQVKGQNQRRWLCFCTSWSSVAVVKGYEQRDGWLKFVFSVMNVCSLL